jgi:sugar/nucleoside kinase (ribokinase family)
VDTSLVVKDQERMTGYSVILLTPRGERTVLVYRGASADFHPRDFRWSAMKTGWIYVSSLGRELAMLKKIWAQAKRRKWKIAWNPGSGELKYGLARLKPLIAQAEIFNVNQEEATSLFRLSREQDHLAFDRLRTMVNGAVVITEGTEGSLGGNSRQAWHCATHHITVADTTGAGDAFGCAFVGMYIRTKGNIPQALQWGTANAEATVRVIGAKGGLLKRSARFPKASIQRIA